MNIYTAAVIVIVVFSSLMLVFISKKKNFFDIRLILAAAASSVIIAFMFPWIYSMFSNSGVIGMGYLNKVLALAASVIVNVILIFIFTVLISSFISEKKTKAISDGFKEKVVKRVIDITSSVVNRLKESIKELSCLRKSQQNGQYTDPEVSEDPCKDLEESVTEEVELEGKIEYQSAQEPQQIEKEAVEAENVYTFEDIARENMELADETFGNLDVGGGQPDPIFNTIDISQNEDTEKSKDIIEKYVDKAFSLKETGDLEGAILNYIYALEKAPEDDLLFWIVIDICSLYKTLGKTELARDILESYASNYSHLMNEAVKVEIERNLSHV